jgi:DNA-directed RNA polymerase subunit RPC12/RpoP
MAIKFSCGRCGKKFVATDEHAGRASKCPKCGWPIVVPKEVLWELELDPEPSPPPLPVAPPARMKATGPSQPKRWRSIIGVPEITGAAILAVLGLIAVATTLASRRAPESPMRTEEPGALALRYTFLDKHIDRNPIYENSKDILSVRLSRKVSRYALKEIAREIHETKPPNPRTGMLNFRTIVYFYLPEVDAFGPDGPFGPPWAMIDHNSPLLKLGEEELVINGFTIDDEIKLVAKWIPPAGDIIGLWIDDSIGKSLWTIYRRDGAFYLGLGQGDKLEEELVGFGLQPFRLFERKKPSKAGDYYRINERGDLEGRDDHGLAFVARRVVVD